MLEPLLGRNIKQVAQQIHWKPPGARHTGYQFHRDLRFGESRASYQDIVNDTVTIGIVIDSATPKDVIDVVLAPGDAVVWGLLTVHGSLPNYLKFDRAFALTSYVHGETSQRGEPAFRDGVSTSLGSVAQLCKYEALYKNLEPHYIDPEWYL